MSKSNPRSSKKRDAKTGQNSAESQRFNPYQSWLGISTDGIIDHYRLLGLRHFENEPAAIEEAADKQMAQVRIHQTGPRSELTQVLLKQIAEAKLCLLNLHSKQVYDQQLHENLSAASMPEIMPPQSSNPNPIIQLPVHDAEKPGHPFLNPGLSADVQTTRYVARRKRFPWEYLVLFGLMIFAAVIAIIVVSWIGSAN